MDTANNTTKPEISKEIRQIVQQKYKKVKIVDGNSEEIIEELDAKFCWKKTLGRIE